MAIIDLDHFKQVNDNYGHDAGDAALVVAAERLRQAVRGGDLVGRWGGEEFLMLLPSARQDELAGIGQRLVQALRGPVLYQDQQFALSASVGLAWSSGKQQVFALDALVKLADQALYLAKHNGRDRAEISADMAS